MFTLYIKQPVIASLFCCLTAHNSHFRSTAHRNAWKSTGQSDNLTAHDFPILPSSRPLCLWMPSHGFPLMLYSQITWAAAGCTTSVKSPSSPPNKVDSYHHLAANRRRGAAPPLLQPSWTRFTSYQGGLFYLFLTEKNKDFPLYVPLVCRRGYLLYSPAQVFTIWGIYLASTALPLPWKAAQCAGRFIPAG